MFSLVAVIGYRVLLIRVDLPDPETPVMQVNNPIGRQRFTLKIVASGSGQDQKFFIVSLNAPRRNGDGFFAG